MRIYLQEPPEQKGTQHVSGEPSMNREYEFPSSHSILEAGGEAVENLLAAIAQCIEELLPGQVLEVVSSEPLAGDAISSWCRDTGHALSRQLAGAEGRQFWIERR